ncbi:hypothetical protein [Chelatococcus asaccharovorans]|uniref:hypothetical protein n=1 Tax=Chelatococcus asaccharovorans TaxID=28210 RepID=UPI00224C7173|nr:hypothetical protein [Chelatococcus asaccharovorans]CAH1671828.1 conserved hypothetical protein [Chelatococcus asaccharovorans]CAH1676761.1 conserved hypothetical protein [Chelatococcus asaccharovorans]
MRYDERRSVYRDCRWCGGRGCLACEAEADAAYKRAFPDGPKPIATFSLSNPQDVTAFKKVFGREALEKAFGPDGGGIAEIEANLTTEKGETNVQQ